MGKLVDAREQLKLDLALEAIEGLHLPHKAREALQMEIEQRSQAQDEVRKHEDQQPCDCASLRKALVLATEVGVPEELLTSAWYKLEIHVPRSDAALRRLVEGASGLRWYKVGKRRPKKGTELTHTVLEAALRTKTEFSEDEWKVFAGFGIKHLHKSDFIKVDDAYFRPADGALLEAQELRDCLGEHGASASDHVKRDAEERLKQLDAADIQLRREMDKLPTETYELHALRGAVAQYGPCSSTSLATEARELLRRTELADEALDVDDEIWTLRMPMRVHVMGAKAMFDS